MKKIVAYCVIVTIGLLCLPGCDPPSPKPKRERPETTPLTDAMLPGLGAQLEATKSSAPSAKTETVLVEAKPGVTGKGQYGQGDGEKPMDIITVPVGEYWKAKERTVFDIQIPHTMQLYKAMHDDKGPDSHEAFMRDIIQANMIVLPPLPEGHEYVYDPSTEKLMVRKPK